ncbi:MAG TPA: hypothetical protein VMH38_05130 [Thermoplasmata archaeon]|nr:hypothetical protein [Thermoplasmata archaeon]
MTDIGRPVRWTSELLARAQNLRDGPDGPAWAMVAKAIGVDPREADHLRRAVGRNRGETLQGLGETPGTQSGAEGARVAMGAIPEGALLDPPVDPLVGDLAERVRTLEIREELRARLHAISPSAFSDLPGYAVAREYSSDDEPTESEPGGPAEPTSHAHQQDAG